MAPVATDVVDSNGVLTIGTVHDPCVRYKPVHAVQNPASTSPSIGHDGALDPEFGDPDRAVTPIALQH